MRCKRIYVLCECWSNSHWEKPAGNNFELPHSLVLASFVLSMTQRRQMSLLCMCKQKWLMRLSQIHTVLCHMWYLVRYRSLENQSFIWMREQTDLYLTHTVRFLTMAFFTYKILPMIRSIKFISYFTHCNSKKMVWIVFFWIPKFDSKVWKYTAFHLQVNYSLYQKLTEGRA